MKTVIQDTFAALTPEQTLHNDILYKKYNSKNTISENLSSSPSLALSATSVRVSQPQLIQDTVALLQKEQFFGEQRANQILGCGFGKQVVMVCQDCGTVTLTGLQGCNARICLACNAKFKQRAYNRFNEVFAHFDRLRFLTLGFVNVSELSREYFQECSRNFSLVKKRLERADHHEKCICNDCQQYKAGYRKKPGKSYHFGTYINVLEVKFYDQRWNIEDLSEEEIEQYKKQKLHFAYAGKKQQIKFSCDEDRIAFEAATGKLLWNREDIKDWNVHYHILFDGDFIHQPVIKEIFKEVTGDSDYVYIKPMYTDGPINSPKAALRYVLKYISKIDGHNFRPEILAEYIKAMKGVRVYNCSIKKKDKYLVQPSNALTCVKCDGQNWYSPYNLEGYLLEQLIDGQEPKQENSYYAPARRSKKREKPMKKEIIPNLEPDCEPLTVIHDDINPPEHYNTQEQLTHQQMKKYALLLMKQAENGEFIFDDIVQESRISEPIMHKIFTKLRQEGDIYEIRPGVYKAL